MSKQKVLSLGLLGGIFTALLPPFLLPSSASERTLLVDSILPLPANTQRSHLTAVDPNSRVEFQIALKMRDRAELETRISRGEVISEAEMMAKYYPLAADYQLLLGWLKSQGLTIEETFPNRLTVVASGSVGKVQTALQTNFTPVTLNRRTYTAASTAPSLPSYLAKFVVGVNGLQPYQQARPLHRLQKLGTVSPYSVRQIRNAYNANVYEPNGVKLDGSGQTIAILIDRFPLDSDLTKFWADNKVPQTLKNIQKVRVAKSIPNIQLGEETLDVQWSSSIAPNAKIRIYGTGDLEFVSLDRGLQRMLFDLYRGRRFNQLSISVGGCESETSVAQKITDDILLTAIASQGVSIFAASGDNGSIGYCEQTGKSGVSYYSSYPRVTGVGGTTLLLNDNGAVQSETGWTGSGGGYSEFYRRPWWQMGLGIAPGKKRLVPDVALIADLPGVYFVFQGQVGLVGGTSVSAPIWAGFSALANQARFHRGKSPLGFLNPRIYPLLGTQSFRDIRVGNNGGFQAANGYDLVTGIGVPVVNSLIPALIQQP